jgi:D-aspartate ligase
VTDAWPHVIVMEPHSAGLAVARRMRRAGARVSAVAEPGDWEVHSRGVTPALAPFADDGEAWLHSLQTLAQGGDQAVVLPASDRATDLLVRQAARLPLNLRMFERSGRGHLALMDKDTADAIARRAGVPVPWTVTIRRPDQLPKLVADAPWPCVVKPVQSHVWRNRYSQDRVFVAHDRADAARLVEQPLADGISMLVSQYIPGGDDDVEEAILVRLDDGSYPIQFGCHKLRQYPRGFGSTTLGESALLPETTALAKRVLDEADFVGVAGVEAKRDPRTGQRWFLEVNVRLPGQWGLGDACGAEATPRLVEALLGRPLGPNPSPRSAVKFVEPIGDAKVCRELLRNTPPRRRPLEAWRLVRPYLGAGELGLLDLRDPRPALAGIKAIAGRRIATRWKETYRDRCLPTRRTGASPST